MQYFRHQQQARQLSRRLVLLFVVGMLSVTLAISAVMLCLAATLSNGLFFFRLPDAAWLQQHPSAWISTVLLVWGVTAGAVLLKRMELRGGGGALARALGGERIDADSREPLYRRLHNVVEEMSIASGLSLPEVYVLPREAGINAFAAGLDPSTAAIAVTRGALELLTRDELQGVVAHEFSHIVNHDIRLNQGLIAWLHGLMALSVIGRGLWRLSFSTDRSRRSMFPPLMVAAAAILVLGYVGRLFGRLMQAAVARRREALADASAVQFTRNPDGLRNALLKIAASDQGAALREVSTDEVAHLLFFPPGHNWFATHPPLADRMRALGGGFDSAEVERMRVRMAQLNNAMSTAERTPDLRLSSESSSESSSELMLTGPGIKSGDSIGSEILATIPVAAVLASVGTVSASQLQWAQQVRQSMPAAVQAAAAQSNAAVALLLALALADETPTQEKQSALIQARLGQSVAERVTAMRVVVDTLQPLQRQPALQLLLPSLRQLPSQHRLQINSCLNAVLKLSASISLAAYALRKLVQVQLHDAGSTNRLRPLKLQETSASLSDVIAVLAVAGHASQQIAHQAYERAMQALSLRTYPRFAPIADWPPQLDKALMQLDRLHPIGKEMLLAAMLLAIAHDGQLTLAELELLRLVCACLHVPLPLTHP